MRSFTAAETATVALLRRVKSVAFILSISVFIETWKKKDSVRRLAVLLQRCCLYIEDSREFVFLYSIYNFLPSEVFKLYLPFLCKTTVVQVCLNSSRQGYLDLVYAAS